MSRDEWLLALETSSRLGSIALALGAAIVDCVELKSDRRNAAELFPTIHALLKRHSLHAPDIGALAFSAGPGSFTGVRVAATVARVLHAATGCRVAKVSTLEALALSARIGAASNAVIAVLLDAKRGQAYCAAFRARGAADLHGAAGASARLACLDCAELRDPAAWLAGLRASIGETTALRVAGDGVTAFSAICTEVGAEIVSLDCCRAVASDVAAIGRAMLDAGEICTPADIVPAYIRVPECEEVYEQRLAAAKARRA